MSRHTANLGRTSRVSTAMRGTVAAPRTHWTSFSGNSRRFVIDVATIRYMFSAEETNLDPGAVLGIFIWVGQSKAKQNLRRPTEVVCVGIMGMTRAVWVGQEPVWVGHGLPGLIARTGSDLTCVWCLYKTET